MKHPLVNRTSPTGKGQPFIGTCAACGKKDIRLPEMSNDYCPNQRGLTNEQALIEAIEGGPPLGTGWMRH